MFLLEHMIQEYNFLRLCFLIIVICLFSGMSSCTYDYFEDETNYVVYVPKADKSIRTDSYKIEDLSILVFKTEIEKEKYSNYPFTENARSQEGNFNFRLYPGEHSVFCFTNMQNIEFSNLSSFSTAAFALKKMSDGYYPEPPCIYSETAAPYIHYPGPVVRDTIQFDKQYVGSICVVFKRLTKISESLTFDNIKKVKILARGVGTVQNLAQITDSITTRSKRSDAGDMMKLEATLYKNPYKDFDFGFRNNYFPSPQNEDNSNEPMILTIDLIGTDNNILYSLDAEITDKNSIPMILHMNETLIVEVDGNDVQVLRLANIKEWSPNIESGGNSSPGNGNGIEL